MGKRPVKKARKRGARPVWVILLCAAAVAGAFYGLKYFFLRSAFFDVKEISVNKDRDYPFREGMRRLEENYVGKNIFAVGLKEAKEAIERGFPELRKVEVRRSLPDTLEVNIMSREPAAVIEAARDIVIDAEGVVLASGERPDGLVGIRGIGFFLGAPGRGEKVSGRTFSQVLMLLRGLDKRMRDARSDVEYIDASDRNNIVLGLSGVVVKMGANDFAKKIDKLREIIKDPKMDLKGIKYIDLRFEPAVISPR